jgi:hypothetical protein
MIASITKQGKDTPPFKEQTQSPIHRTIYSSKPLDKKVYLVPGIELYRTFSKI